LVDLDKSILSNNLYGVDLNLESVEITKLSLWLKTASKHKELTALDENVKCGNSLIDDKSIDPKAFEWEKEFSFTFDVVVGNPPYGAELNKKSKDFLRNKYPELQFKIDTYSVFILKSIELLRKNSYCYFIIPNTFLDNYFEEKIREKLLKQNQVKEVIDLSDNIFKEAVVHSMILGFKKAVKSNYLIKANTSKNLTEEYLCIPNTYFFEQDKFVFAIRNYNQKDILNKLDVNSAPLKKILDIRQAIKTGNDKVYITPDKKNENFKPILRGRDIRKWSIINPDLYVYYGNHLACPRDSEIFEQPKILLRESGNRIIATYDDNDFFDLKYVLCLINSRIFQYQLKLIAFEKTKGTFTKARIFHYYKLPVKKNSSEQQQPFIEKADKMLTLNQKLCLTQNEFLNWLKIQYGLEKQSKKLESFYELDEEAFFAELKKKLPKENKSLSPKQTGEIKQYFEVYRQKIIALKNEIEKTDSEIDEMVYELYGLTKEEIEIVRR
jgi:tRNA1(Val) A37 N6-methylase TrmN6